MYRVIDQMLRTVQVPQRPRRIISLVPSQTELLHDLGLDQRVVGITKFCVHPQEWFHSKSRVGGTKKVDLEKVRALRPDLIIGNKEENDQVDIEALAQEFPVWMSDVRTLDDALGMITELGTITNTVDQALSLAGSIAAGFEQFIPGPPRTVLYLIWQEPWMAAGSDTFINAMLERCGLENVCNDLPGRYPQLQPGQIRELGPQVVLLSSEPYPFKEKHLNLVFELLPKAHVALVDGEMFSWYGSRLLHVPKYLRRVILDIVK